MGNGRDEQTEYKLLLEKDAQIGVAVDLGSTSVAVSIMDLSDGKEIDSFTFENPQRAYGADIISRIRYGMEKDENLKNLSDCVREAFISRMLSALGADSTEELSALVKKIVICGNTTMQHLFRGLSVDGLSMAPFCPVTIDYVEESSWFDRDISIIYPPSVSAFVGADVLAGAAVLSMGQQECYDLLIDLGTNGEIILVNQEKGYATSTACGPVFDHAIGGARYGSDCIKAVANCVRRHLIKEDGVLVDAYFEKGIALDRNFVLKQQHIRNFQLAKGAIYAGILCLMQCAGIGFEQIHHVYISGGLGFYMDVRDAFTVKMLPKPLQGNITITGNTSLLGAKRILEETVNMHQKTDILKNMERIKDRTKSIELANMQEFQSIFLDSLNF